MLSSVSSRMLRRAISRPGATMKSAASARRAMSSETHTFDITGSYEVSKE